MSLLVLGFQGSLNHTRSPQDEKDRETDRQTDRQTGRQAGRQAERQRETDGDREEKLSDNVSFVL